MIGVGGKQALNAWCRLRFWSFGLLCFITSLNCFSGGVKEEQLYDFNVTVTDVAEALNQIAAQTGEVLLYPYEAVEGKTVNPVVGRYSLMEALQILLWNSGLSSNLTDRGAVRIDLDGVNARDHRGITQMKLEKKSLGSALAAAFVSIFGAAESSHGQEPMRQASSLEEIVVTAQKREQSMNDVGITITAASGERLTAAGVTEITGLSAVVPGFSAGQAWTGYSIFSLRGVNFNSTQLSAPPAVSTYVDEAVLPYPAMTGGLLLDVERVEVLKGPQGTLFGQNATGGSINIIAAKPTDYFTAGARSEVNHFGQVMAEGYVSGPLSETLNARLAANTTQFGAWQKGYYLNDNKNGDQDKGAARLLLDWTPTDQLNVNININLNGSYDHGEAPMPQLMKVTNLLASSVTPACLSAL